MNSWNKQLTICCLFLAAFLTGCSQGVVSNAVVQGTVTIDGDLASRGTVTFYPVKEGPVAVGQIHSDGSFSLRMGKGNSQDPDASKIPEGNYVATVMVMGDPVEGEAVAEGGPPLAGPRLMSCKYASKDTSGLEFEVKPGSNVFALQLEGPEQDEPEEPAAESGEDSEETSKETVTDPAAATQEAATQGNPAEEATSVAPAEEKVQEDVPAEEPETP